MTNVSDFDRENHIRAARGITNPAVASNTLLVRGDDGDEVEAAIVTFRGKLVTEGDDYEAIVEDKSGVRSMLNNSGADVPIYATVVTDPTEDDAFTTTTSAQVSDRAVGVTQAAILAGETGPVMFGGITRIGVDDAVTRGDFVETSTTAGSAGTNPTRREGSFGVLLEGADPDDVTVPGIDDLIIDTASSTLSVAGTSFAFAMPTTRPDGMVAILKLSRAVSTAVTLVGWTLIGTVADDKYYYRATTVSEPATYTASWTTASLAVALVVILDGLDTASPVEDSAFDATSAAAVISGLSTASYLVLAGLQATTLPATPSGWTALVAATIGTAGGTASIVQQASQQTNIFPATVSLASPVTPGNLLILVGSGRTGGIDLNPTVGVSGRAFTSYGQVQAFLGRGYLDIAYRVATGDEQFLTFNTQHANIIVYEVADAGSPAPFEVKSATLQAASGTKSLGAFGSPGDLQIAGFIWDATATDQTAGTGYTQDLQVTSVGTFEPSSLYEHDTAGGTPQITGTSHAWAGMAIGITSASTVIGAELVAQTVYGTGATSPFSGAGEEIDGLLALAFLEPPLVDVALPLVLLWGGAPDLSDGSSSFSGIAEDLTTAETDTTLVLAPDGAGGVEFRAETGGSEAPVAHGSMGATESIDVSAGSWHQGTLDANCTISFTGLTAGVVARWQVETFEDGTGGWSPTWPGSVVWVNGVAPTHDTTAGSTTIYSFASRDGGVTVFGAAGGGQITVENQSVALATAASSLDFVGAGVVASGTGAAKTIMIAGGASLGATSTDVPGPGVASSAGAGITASPITHLHALTYHDEPLTDGASNFIFDGGDIVVVTGVPN